jgi:hypothetical protein
MTRALWEEVRRRLVPEFVRQLNEAAARLWAEQPQLARRAPKAAKRARRQKRGKS